MRVWLTCVMIWMLACGSEQAGKMANTSMPKTTDHLSSPGDRFDYRVGNPHFQGRTEIKVFGDRRAEVTFESGGKVDRYADSVSPELMRELNEALAAHSLDRYQSDKGHKPVPDEVQIELGLTTGGATVERQMWYNERYTLEYLDDLIQIMDRIASQISKGKVEY